MTAAHDTTDLVDLIIQDHREFERAFAELERNQSAEYRRSLVDHLIADLTRQLRELGHAVEAAKKIAPTRPHPDAPDTPPANLLIGPCP